MTSLAFSCHVTMNWGLDCHASSFPLIWENKPRPTHYTQTSNMWHDREVQKRDRDHPKTEHWKTGHTPACTRRTVSRSVSCLGDSTLAEIYHGLKVFPARRISECKFRDCYFKIGRPHVGHTLFRSFGPLGSGVHINWICSSRVKTSPVRGQYVRGHGEGRRQDAGCTVCRQDHSNGR